MANEKVSNINAIKVIFLEIIIILYSITVLDLNGCDLKIPVVHALSINTLKEEQRNPV